MLRANHVRRAGLIGSVLFVAAFVPACTVSIVPGPEAVLQGTWKLTTGQQTTLTDTFLTFDAYGDLSKVQYKVGSNVTITNNSPNGQVAVNGDNVTIDSTFAGNGIKIVGTLNADKTVITGSQGTDIQIAGITISIDNGAVTLTKQ